MCLALMAAYFAKTVLVQATVRDMYRRKDLGVFQGSFTGAVLVHGVLALKITPLRCACTASPMQPPRFFRALHVALWVLSCAVEGFKAARH